MLNKFIITGGKLASNTLKTLGLGNGSTLPGHIALRMNKRFIHDVLSHSTAKIIIIAGTNGKTTSSHMLRSILEADGKNVLHNESGANLKNGIASSLLLQTDALGQIKADYIILEVDENALPGVLQEVTPDYLLLLNLFRDQLDRYGEVDTVALKWKQAFATLPKKTMIIANADDPKTAYLGMSRESTVYFGLTGKSESKKRNEQAVDSVYCPKCHGKLVYKTIYYSHLGEWHCPSCKLQRPDIKVSKDINLSLSGTYNKYNAHGIIELSHQIGTRESAIANALKSFIPAFGRQEKIQVGEKTTQLFLSKNPTGLNESLSTIGELKGKHVLLVLNDRYADGTDVSWIWDVDMEAYLPEFTNVTVSGDRCYDMGLRLKYAEGKEQRAKSIKIEAELKDAIASALSDLPTDEVLYILPTYTAMLDTRQILTGRKIL